jgi:plasmid stabilization system protein ParE
VKRFKVELDVDALSDLAGIRDHIAAARGAAFAADVVGRIFDHLAGFESGPLRGSPRNDIRRGLRIVGWRRRLTIAFMVDEAAATVMIYGVLYRGRDVEAVLKRRGG